MDAFIARQPILDCSRRVQGYELLFRNGLENVFPDVGLDQACAKVIVDSLFLPRLDAVSGGKQAFVNVTREILVGGYVSLLPRSTTVVEILETIRPDRAVIEACRRLKSQGYRLALDDFRYGPAWEPMLALADIVKVDVLASNAAERAALADRLKRRGITLLAEKVETPQIYREAVKLGFQLFQGYYFARPVVVSGRDIPVSKLSYLRILREIHRPDMDYARISDIIEREVALTYKLLRYINSAAFAWWGSVSSIRHALLLLGQNEIRRWASVMVIAGLAADEPSELVTLALLRARFCELLAPLVNLQERSLDLFLIGLFSMIGAILQCPLDEVLRDLPIADDAKAGLLGEPGTLREALDLAIAYIQADWPTVEDLAARLGVPEANLPILYESALAWCGEDQRLGRMGMAA